MNKLATKSVKPEVVRKLKDDGHFFSANLIPPVYQSKRMARK